MPKSLVNAIKISLRQRHSSWPWPFGISVATQGPESRLPSFEGPSPSLTSLTPLTPVSPKLENVIVEYVELDDFLKDQEEAPLVAQGFIHGSSKGLLFGDAKKPLFQAWTIINARSMSSLRLYSSSARVLFRMFQIQKWWTSPHATKILPPLPLISTTRLPKCLPTQVWQVFRGAVTFLLPVP